MVGKTPAAMALAAMIAMFASTGECAAQTDSPATPAEANSAIPAADEQATQEAEATPELSTFDAWRDRFRARALKDGIPHDVFERALGNVRPDPKVHEKDSDQPEFTRAIWDYLDGALSESRVSNGRKMLRRHASLLAEAERAYGVPRQFLVAIWGMESSYGALLGNHNIFEALATLSYRGDRRQYGEEQLLAALRLLADGHKPLEAMKGSWAGAVGHTQFVPTTYLKYAVDGDKDGRRDLWDSLSDVFHSTAHYLKKSGFNPNLKWGREAFLPNDFDYALAGYHVTKPLSEWRELGVKMANGKLVPDMDITASILVPAGHQGPAFLVYENFQAILAYNHSTSYALGIGLLSDQISDGPSLKQSWPRHLKPLALAERIEIQKRLAALGYDPGGADGVLGRQTRKAIRAFQKDQGDIADGYATADLIAKLRAAKPGDAAGRISQAEPEPSREQSSAEETDLAAADDATATVQEVAATKTPEPQAVAVAGEVTASQPESGVGETSAAQEPADDPQEEEAAASTVAQVPSLPDQEIAPEATEEESISTDLAETSDTTNPPGERSTPPEKATVAGGSDTTAGEPTAEPTPLPREKPAVAAAQSPASPSDEPAIAEVTPSTLPRAKPEANVAKNSAGLRRGGVAAALAAPGLVILGKGMAAQIQNAEQGAATPAPSADSESGHALPVNNNDESIVSPPGVAYVGTYEGTEQAESTTDAEDDSDSDTDDSGEPENTGEETPESSEESRQPDPSGS